MGGKGTIMSVTDVSLVRCLAGRRARTVDSRCVDYDGGFADLTVNQRAALSSHMRKAAK